MNELKQGPEETKQLENSEPSKNIETSRPVETSDELNLLVKTRSEQVQSLFDSAHEDIVAKSRLVGEATDASPDDIVEAQSGLSEIDQASARELLNTLSDFRNISANEASNVSSDVIEAVSVTETPAAIDLAEREVKPDATLKEKVEQRKGRAEALSKAISALRKENPQDYIEKFNNTVTPEEVSGLQLSLIKTSGEKLLIVDQSGRLTEITCTAKNAKEVLKSVKEADEVVRGNSNDLRSEILRISEGRIKTPEAYTYGDIDSMKGPDLKKFLNEKSNWTDDRRLLHDQIVARELEKAAALSGRMGDSEPTIYALRGNTAAGKTTRVKSDPTFQRAIDLNGEPTGAINPDIYKEQLKSEEIVFGRQKITHFQSHNEGSMLARRIKSQITESDSSMIIDQRLNEAKDIEDLIAESEKTGKKLKFLDVESPMENSLIRILGRRPGGVDPLPPFIAVAEGYEGVRKNRAALLEAARSNPAIENYVLYVADEKGQSVKVAEKVGDQIIIPDECQKLYDQALNGDTESTVEQLRTQVIDDAYIARAKNELDIPSFQIKALEKYKGMTFEGALAEHSRQIDSEAPSYDIYLAEAMRNLDNTSRTAKGTVNVSASPDKAAKMQEGLTGESAAELAKNNFQEAIRTAYENKQSQFESPDELRQFVESIAATVNKGIIKEGTLIRSGEDSPKYPYTRIADLPNRMEKFYEEFEDRLKNPKEDPKSLAAWVEYKIDLSDHFFGDGCGKTAKLISSWVMMRAEKNLPDYTMGGKIPSEQARENYYKNAPSTIPGTNPEREAEELRNWTNYYKQL
ncbi:MAG: hypothetical protein WCI57_03835 [Candidatus Berkelbacteria bacterium]